MERKQAARCWFLATGTALLVLGWLGAAQIASLSPFDVSGPLLAPLLRLKKSELKEEEVEFVPPCDHGTMYYNHRCICPQTTTGPLCELFEPWVAEQPSLDLCLYDVNQWGLGWSYGEPWTPNNRCNLPEQQVAFAAAFAFKLAPAALPYEASAAEHRDGSGDPFIEHILRTFGPWDTEDARLLEYFTGDDATISWSSSRDSAVLPPSSTSSDHIGLIMIVSGNADIDHFVAWWSCWGHRSHTIFRYVIHLDASAPQRLRRAILAATMGDKRVVVVPPHHSIAGAWGAVTLVYIHLIGLDIVLGAFPSVEYIVNLSLHDVLLMTPADLQRQLRESNVDIILHSWPDPADDVRSKRGGPRAPFRVSHYINGVSHLVFDLPSTPWSIQRTLWNESWPGPGGPTRGVSVEWGSSQWSAWSAAGARALLSDRVLVQLLFSLKHTSVPDERFMGAAAVRLERHRGLRWQRRFRRFHGNPLSLGTANELLQQSLNDRPFMTRKVFWNATAGTDEALIWRQVWGEVQPACVSEPYAV